MITARYLAANNVPCDLRTHGIKLHHVPLQKMDRGHLLAQEARAYLGPAIFRRIDGRPPEAAA